MYEYNDYAPGPLEIISINKKWLELRTDVDNFFLNKPLNFTIRIQPYSDTPEFPDLQGANLIDIEIELLIESEVNVWDSFSELRDLLKQGFQVSAYEFNT